MAKKLDLDIPDAVLGILFAVLLVAPYTWILEHDSLRDQIADIWKKCDDATMLPTKVVEAHLKSVAATIESDRASYMRAVQKVCEYEKIGMEKITCDIVSGYNRYTAAFKDRTAYMQKRIASLR